MATIKNQIHESRWQAIVEDLWHDIRYAMRMLRNSPGFTLTAVLTIALGIGATTAIFSVVDATLLHPLPYPQPEQLVRIVDDLPGVGGQDVGLSAPEWWDLQRTAMFEYISPAWYDEQNLTGSAHPARVGYLSVAPNYFALLGVQPQLGNAFNPSDPTRGFAMQIVISDGLWKRGFGSDPNILGRKVQLDTDWYQIVGVMPPGFHDPGRTTDERNVEVWSSTGFASTPWPDPPRRGYRIPEAIARLKPGMTLAVAQSRVNELVASLQKQFPVDYPAQSAWTVRLVPLKESVVGNVRRSLVLMLTAVGLVLLIGCVNVANLLLARASARGREMAIRQAMGAARARLTRQLLTEGLFLSLLGGITGFAILFFTKKFLLQLVPDGLPQLNEITISWSVLLFTFGVSLIAGTIFGLTLTRHSRGLDITNVLKQEGRGSTGSGQQARTRRLLVIGEFALSLMLMIGASLLLRSFWDLLNVPLGFNPQNVMMVRTRLPFPNDPKADLYATPAQEAPFLREVLRRSRTLPGVEEVAIGNKTSIPLDHNQRDLNLLRVYFEGMQTTEPRLIDGSMVSPEYFHLMGMTLLRGRLFNDLDNENGAPVVLINEAMAQAYWPNEDPMGKHLKLYRRQPTWSTVVGVVANARTESLEDARVPKIYGCLYQSFSDAAKHLAVFLRGHLDTAAIPEEVREQIQSVNPTLPVFGAQTLDDILSNSLSVRRFSMEIIALFALTALLLAGLGIYGVISYMVNARTQEIGIQLALGAQRGKILRMVLRQGLSLAIIGAAVGLVGALIVSHLMSGLLYGVKPTDPVTFIGVMAVLTVVAVAACYIPALRAVRVDPIVALRYQ